MVMIIKANGEKEKFEEKRLLGSLQRAGAEAKTASRVLEKIRAKLYDGISTKKIYRMAFNVLKKIDNPTASRYKIKWAMMRLGKRQGFSFEQYMERLFEKMGYDAETNIIAQGKYITHEVDVTLEKAGERILVECKHRSKPAIWVHVKTALALHSRLLDLKEKYDKAILVTNSRFTKHAIQYANGIGIKLIAWDQPANENLKGLIDSYRVYPITVLKSVDDASKRKLLSHKLVVIYDLVECKRLDEIVGHKKANEILSEAHNLLKIKGEKK
ncbi:MAG: restriction endonuclease [Nanoarchaeota archaeon]|nr:restriction endonuclease [Nanoarchaeota archaeon]